ncbi:hypothetical protein C8Q75DRAFT_753174 [Abortiporus biennis]|nr:hypothetical protein C8Q75DRAFT_753174 [Abortiporus biennis]
MPSEITIVGQVSAQLQTVSLPLGFTGCVPTHVESYAWSFWLPMIIYESTVFLLAISKAIRMANGRPTRRSNFTYILFRDSILYFAPVLAVMLTNCIIWARRDLALSVAFPSTLFPVHGILGFRMLINIQRAASSWNDSFLSDTFHSSTSPSTPIHFASTLDSSSGEHPEYIPLNPVITPRIRSPPSTYSPREFEFSALYTRIPSHSKIGD